MEDKTILSAIAIVCLTIIQIMALILGYDNYLMVTIVAIIAGLAGYKLKSLIGGEKKK